MAPVSAMRTLLHRGLCGLGLIVVAACGDDGAPAVEQDILGCPPNATRVGALRTVEQAVAAINAMPRPARLECFVARLERPLRMNATDSLISFQPAVGRASPRLFLFDETLIMSVVVDGPGQALLELSEVVAPGRTIKAEIEFPVVGPVAISDPFTRIEDGAGTTCGLCHAPEAPSDRYPNAYVSAGLAFAERQRVFLTTVRAQYEACLALASDARDQRCRLFLGLMHYGPTEETDFPSEFGTIVD